MEYELIIARSVTYAQRIERVLERAGIRAAVFRAPFELSDGNGCAYAVRVPVTAASAAKNILQKNELSSVRWVRIGENGRPREEAP